MGAHCSAAKMAIFRCPHESPALAWAQNNRCWERRSRAFRALRSWRRRRGAASSVEARDLRRPDRARAHVALCFREIERPRLERCDDSRRRGAVQAEAN
jgi:hypothetical protein